MLTKLNCWTYTDEKNSLIDDDIEIKCMKRCSAKRPFGAISDLSKKVQNLDPSPPCKYLSQPRKLQPQMPLINQAPRPLAGLVTAKDFKDEIARIKKQELLW